METRYKKSERVNFVENASHRSKVASISAQETFVELKFPPYTAGRCRRSRRRKVLEHGPPLDARPESRGDSRRPCSV